MAWPVNAINGQTTTINGVVYVYNSTKNAWSPASVAGVTTITYAGNVAAGNVNVTGSVYQNGLATPTLNTMLAFQLAM
jgi:hypothetical protein